MHKWASSVIIALDAMGGDGAPRIVVEGALKSLEKQRHARCLLYGDKEKLLPILYTCQVSLPPVSIVEAGEVASHRPAVSFGRGGALSDRICLVHTPDFITNETKPAVAVRMRHSSMRLAIESVANGTSSAVVSAGNTGAYMALSKIILKTLDGIDRPAIPALLPTVKGLTLMLDLGANIDCTADNLVQFAILGEAFARCFMPCQRPSIGLLNVGSEENKGHTIVQEAAQRLHSLPSLNFHGFVEGNDIAAGTTDVVVTDGFTGNIALKTLEGTARLLKDILHKNLTANLRGKLGYLMAKPAFEHVKRKTDPRFYNGAGFLGLRGIAVKSHGSMDAIGFENAIDMSLEMVAKDYIRDIDRSLKGFQDTFQKHAV